MTQESSTEPCIDMPIDYPEPAKSDKEAAERYSRTREFDPFPNIEPSLLNSADIMDYVRNTGMLHPFLPTRQNEDGKTEEALKGSSYEIPIGGQCIYWDKDRTRIKIDLTKEEYFDLLPNSIAFVQVETRFRLPLYIALRFNLRIKHVHRGILLGTGPLIDPGFDGNLLIPLHNLTNNTYRFRRNEGLIWVEFTKVTRNSQWDKPEHRPIKLERYSRKGQIVPFPPNKVDKDPCYYLDRANDGNSIQSSIPIAIKNAERESEEARKESRQAIAIARETDQKVSKLKVLGALIATIGTIVTVVTIMLPILGLVQDSRTAMQPAIDFYKEQNSQIKDAKRITEETKISVNSASKSIESLEIQLQELRKELDILRHERDAVKQEGAPVPSQTGKSLPAAR